MDEVIHALNSASTDAELNAALLRATPYNDSHLVRDAIIAAQEKQERRRRMGMLTVSQPPVTRQESHQERM